MSTFKVGEKVVCVDAVYPLLKNEIYTIDFIDLDGNDEETLILKEVYSGLKFSDNEEEWYGYDPVRFRKLDYQFTENLIAELMQSEYQLN